MKTSGLPPELKDLLERLHRRGIPITPLEIARLRHLLGIGGEVQADDLKVLLSAVLCKEARHRILFQREYRRWQTDFDRTRQSDGDRSGEALTDEIPDVMRGMDPGRLGLGILDRLRPGTTRGSRWRSGLKWVRRYRRHLALSGAILVLAIGVWFAPSQKPIDSPRTTTVSDRPTEQVQPTAALCPQDLPTEAVAEVWAWVPRPDHQPWLAAGGGLALLLCTIGIGWRLVRADRRYLRAQGVAGASDRAPRQGLPRMPVHGDLLLDPAARREMIWSVGRYISEVPSRELDAEATVTATAGAGGEPRIVHRRLSFPRQVWLWCDQKTANPALQGRLIDEIRDALDQANLPVRIARFHGLPSRLVWDDNREPFTPAYNEAAGAEAVVAIITDGTAMVRAWESPGDRPPLERLLRELHAWPRLCLADLGENGDLRRLCAEWRLQASGGEGLTAWLAGRSVASDRTPSDPAQLDLWAAAWLLANPAEDHATAQALRQAMELRLHPLDYPLLLARLADCTKERTLADRLVSRLSHSQTLNEQGLPLGDGYFSRALDFWERRLESGIAAIHEDDNDSRARLSIDLARLRLWRDPEGAAAELIRLDQGRNGQLIRAGIVRLFSKGAEAPAPDEVRRGPAWRWKRLPSEARYHLLKLGLKEADTGDWDLRLGVRHHLALALFAGMALSGLGWGIAHLLTPEIGTEAVFQTEVFQQQVVEANQGERVWLGSPWFLSDLPAFGPFDTPYTWSWEPLGVENPQRLGPESGVFFSGSQAFPIRACDPDWPERSLAVIAAPLTDKEPAAWTEAELAARQLAIRLLDRGATDRVLIAPDWEQRLVDLTQGIQLTDDQLIVFLPPDAPAPATDYAAGFARAAEVRGEPAALAAALNFHWPRPVDAVWPAAVTRILAGKPSVRGGPEIWVDGKTGITWVHACGGTFSMGSLESEDRHLEEYARDYVEAFGGTQEERKSDFRRWLSWEQPRHPVLVDRFWITRTELTHGQHQAIGGDADGKLSLPRADIDWIEASAACQGLPLPPGSIEDDWLPKPSLASEAQWEYAARAGTATRWSFGDDPDVLGDYAWFRGNAESAPHPVSEKRPNNLCLADMHGNVYEWVDDCFAEDSYRSRGDALVLDPREASEDCERRVVRGGSFEYPPGDLRSAYRVDIRPGGRNEGLGLRCVRSRARQH